MVIKTGNHKVVNRTKPVNSTKPVNRTKPGFSQPGFLQDNLLFSEFTVNPTFTLKENRDSSKSIGKITRNDPGTQGLISEAVALLRDNSGCLEQRIHLFKLMEKQLIRKASEESAANDGNSANQISSLMKLIALDEKETSKDSDKDAPVISISYSFAEEEFRNGLYSQAAIDYVRMFYGDTGKIPPEFAGEYTLDKKSDVSSETIEGNIQAQKTMVDIQYATITGAYSSVNFKERKQFDTWIKFNPDLFWLFQRNFGLTQEIDYSRIG